MLLLALILLILTPFSSPVFAAFPAQQDDMQAKADSLYQEAIDLYDQRDYQGSIHHGYLLHSTMIDLLPRNKSVLPKGNNVLCE